MSKDTKPKTKKIKITTARFMTGLTIFLMLGSVLAIWMFNPSSGSDQIDQGNSDIPMFEVDGYNFYETGDGTFGAFLSTTGGVPWPIKFRLDPREAGGIEVDPAAAAKIYSSNKIYIAYNPNEEEIAKISIAAIEIARIVPLITGLSITEAFTEDSNPINPEVPLKTCEDATKDSAIIVLEVADKNEVSREGECIVVRGVDPDNVILSADKFGMHLVGLKV